MKVQKRKLIQFILFMPLIPTVFLGIQKGLNWQGYFMLYFTMAVLFAFGLFLYWLIYRLLSK